MTNQSSTSGAGWLLSNVWTVIAVVVIIASAAHAFVKGGIPQIALFTNLIVYSMPFATILITFFLLRKHTMILITQEKQWYLSAITLGCFVIMFALGLYETRVGPTFTKIYDNTYMVSGNVIVSIGALTAISASFRIFRAKTWLGVLIMSVVALSILTSSPLGGMIFPPITELGQFFSNSVVAGGNAAFEVTAFLGISAMIARVLIGKEKLTPEATTTVEEE
jgi:hypothetical protein